MPNLGVGLGLPRAVNVTNNPILNRFGGASVAYSLRKISASATKSIRVRRDNDHEEQDIGFVGRELDTVSLLSFVGGNNGYVTTWYDQSGNGRDAVQGTADNQPRIVDAGTYEGGVNFYTNSSVLEFTALPTSWDAVVTGTPGSASVTYRTLLKDTVNGNHPFLIKSAGTDVGAYDGLFKSTEIDWGSGEKAVFYIDAQTSNIAMAKNGGNAVASGSNAFRTADRLGSNAGSGQQFGLVHEFVVYSALSDTARTAIESSQMDYYNITV